MSADIFLKKWLDEDRAAHVFQWGRLALSLAVFADQDDNRSLAWSMHHAMRHVLFCLAWHTGLFILTFFFLQ